jgi:hypothetical protein
MDVMCNISNLFLAKCSNTLDHVISMTLHAIFAMFYGSCLCPKAKSCVEMDKVLFIYSETGNNLWCM